MNPQFPPLIIGGAGYYKYIKENISDSTSLILDGGNFFQGHPISIIDSGKTMIEFMNNIGYTALVPGPDDFVYGLENLNKLAESSNFPFLIANLKCNSCDLISNNFKPYTIKEINGVKYSHTISTKTGYFEKNRMLSVTVIYPSCMLSDAYATAFMAMGIKKSKEFLHLHSKLKVYIVYSDIKGGWKTFSTENLEIPE